MKRQTIRIVIFLCMSHLIQSPTKGAAMTPPTEKVMKLVQLKDQDFFNLDRDANDVVSHQLLMMKDFEGIVLGAPRKVDLGRHAQLPVLWLMRATQLRNWQVVLKRNATVVITDLLHGTTALYYAFGGGKRYDFRSIRASQSKAPPTGRHAESAGATPHMLDIRKITNLPWQPGRYAISIISYDWLTNTVVVELEAESKKPQTPSRMPADQARTLVAKLHKASSDGKKPPQNFEANSLTPTICKPGISLSVPEKPISYGKGFQIQGAGKVALYPGAIVEKGLSTGKEATGIQTPDAVIRCRIVLIELDRTTEPRNFEVLIPIHAKDSLTPGALTAFSFTLDVEAHLKYSLPAADYLVYAVVAEHITGPRKVSIISE